MVSDIKAQATADGEVTVTWRLPPLPEGVEAGSLAVQLYRTQEQKAGSRALEGLAPVATLPYGTMSYTDRPGARGTFHYTAILVQEGRGFGLAIPGTNSTVEGVRLLPASPPVQEPQPAPHQEEPGRSTGIRNTPLPYLRMLLSQPADKAIPLNPERSQGGLSSRTEGTGAALPQQHIFRQEQEEESTGEDSILQEIVSTHLKTGSYRLAEQSLRDFLSINRSKDATDRGTFYLGEALLYQGKYRQALSCFLAVQDRFPDLTARWIQAALDGYQLPVME